VQSSQTLVAGSTAQLAAPEFLSKCGDDRGTQRIERGWVVRCGLPTHACITALADAGSETARFAQRRDRPGAWP